VAADLAAVFRILFRHRINSSRATSPSSDAKQILILYECQGPQLGGNLQRWRQPSRSFWSHRSTNWANARFSTNSQYEGRNPDGSSFRSQFPMGNNPPRPRVMTQGPESMLEQPLREEVGDTFNRRIQGQMGQSQGRGEFYQPPGASQENLNERKATAGIAQHRV
jgi:hypothetical protein